MDPTTSYLEMLAAMNHKDYTLARERAIELKRWLRRGGFYPLTYSKTEVDAYLASVLRQTAHLA
jgi:hypothetical protein